MFFYERHSIKYHIKKYHNQTLFTTYHHYHSCSQLTRNCIRVTNARHLASGSSPNCVLFDSWREFRHVYNLEHSLKTHTCTPCRNNACELGCAEHYTFMCVFILNALSCNNVWSVEMIYIIKEGGLWIPVKKTQFLKEKRKSYRKKNVEDSPTTFKTKNEPIHNFKKLKFLL